MTDLVPAASTRRLLVNGERLMEVVDRANGGGPKYDPQTFDEARIALLPQFRSLVSEVEAIPDGYRAERVVFEATLLPNYIANSYFPDRLLTQTGLTALGSRHATGVYRTRTTETRDAPTKKLLLAGNEEEIREFGRLLDGRIVSRSDRSAADEIIQFESIALTMPTIVNDSREVAPTTSGLRAFEAVLHPDPDRSSSVARVSASPLTLALLERAVERLGGEVKSEFIAEVGGLTFVPLLLTPVAEQRLQEFNPLRALRPMPRIRPLRDRRPEPPTQRMAAPSLPARENAPEVYVFDGGADHQGALFAGSVTTTDLVADPVDPVELEHGEAVTAAVLFGPVQPGDTLDRPAARVRHYRVTPSSPNEGEDLPLLLRSIEQTLAGSSGALVNLSLGPDYEVDDLEPHQWTAVLDKLAYEQGAMFVTAPGNNGEDDEAFGLNRVQVPSDMVNGISVGACTVPAPLTPWTRTEYSPVGPGRAGARVQPTVVAFGGTDTMPFGRLRADGTLIADAMGTSYAAPQLTHALAGLRAELGTARGNAPALRAFAVHFAERQDDPLLNEVGYGRTLRRFDDVLQSPPNSVTVLYQGTVARDEVRAFYLPVPDALQSGNVHLRCTLAFTSPTDPTEAAEYTKAALEHRFRPHALKFRYTEPDASRRPGQKPRTLVRHDVNHRDEVTALLQAGWTRSLNPWSTSVHEEAEHVGRDQGKWETLWDATQTYRASSLFRPRLDLSHISRAAGQLTRGGDDVDFSLLVTVTAKADVPLYEQVTAQFAVLDTLPVTVGDVETPLET